MVLPQGFSEWEHLQNALMQTYNRVVRAEFSDTGDENWDPTITTPRASLRVACTIKDSDSALMVHLRMSLFYMVLRKASDLQLPVYGIPVDEYHAAVTFRPQIQLYFQEDSDDVEPGYAPVTGEIGFRLMNETSESVTQANVNNWANKIKTNFATGANFTWRKGRLKCAYYDREKGYRLQLLVTTEAEGKRVIEQVLDIQNHAPDWEYLSVVETRESSSRFPTIPPTKTIVGKPRRMPRRRPVATVKFRHALLFVYGLPQPIVLVDTSMRYRDAVLSA